MTKTLRRKLVASLFSIVLLFIVLSTSTFAAITNNNVGVTGIKVKIDNGFASGVTFEGGSETKDLNVELANMKPVKQIGFNFYLDDEEDNLSGDDLFANVVYDNLLLKSINGEKTLYIRNIEFTNVDDEIAKSLRVGIRLLDDFFIYTIETTEFNQAFEHKLTENVSVVSLFVWFEETDPSCTAYNVSQATECIGLNITLGVE